MSLDRLLHPKTRGDAMGLQICWPGERDRIAPCIKMAKDLGVGIVRVSGDWVFHNPRAGVYTPEYFDRQYNAVLAAGLVPMLVCGYTPNYLSNGRSQHPGLDPNKLTEGMEEYRESMYRLGKRFPEVHFIELYSNEANCKFGIDPPDPVLTYCLASAGAEGWRRAKQEQNKPSLIMMNSLANCPPEMGHWSYEWVQIMYDIHNWLAGLGGMDGKTLRTPWDVLNSHPYMTWSDAFAAKNQGTGNPLTYHTSRLIADQVARQADGRTDITQPFVMGTEAGWPTILGQGLDSNVKYIARLGGWNGRGTPTTVQIETGAGKMAESHLRYWFQQQDKNLLGVYSIFHYDDTDWRAYGLMTNIIGGRRKRHYDVIKRIAHEAWTPPAGWMKGLGVVPT